MRDDSWTVTVTHSCCAIQATKQSPDADTSFTTSVFHFWRLVGKGARLTKPCVSALKLAHVNASVCICGVRILLYGTLPVPIPPELGTHQCALPTAPTQKPKPKTCHSYATLGVKLAATPTTAGHNRETGSRHACHPIPQVPPIWC